MADRPLPPPLEARCPDCSVCGEETNYVDASFDCENCNCSWSESGVSYDSGEWLDPEVDQCAETVQPYLDNTWIKDDDERKQKSYRCVRDADHVDSTRPKVREHAHPEMSVCVRRWA